MICLPIHTTVDEKSPKCNVLNVPKSFLHHHKLCWDICAQYVCVIERPGPCLCAHSVHPNKRKEKSHFFYAVRLFWFGLSLWFAIILFVQHLCDLAGGQSSRCLSAVGYNEYQFHHCKNCSDGTDIMLIPSRCGLKGLTEVHWMTCTLHCQKWDTHWKGPAEMTFVLTHTWWWQTHPQTHLPRATAVEELPGILVKWHCCMYLNFKKTCGRNSENIPSGQDVKCENERFKWSLRTCTKTASVTVGRVQLLVIPGYALKNVN